MSADEVLAGLEGWVFWTLLRSACLGFRGAVHDFLVSLSMAPMQSSSGYRLRPTLRHQEQDPRFEVVVDSARLRGTLIHVRSVRPAMHTLVWAL